MTKEDIRDLNQYDAVELYDGRFGCVVEILGDYEELIIDIDVEKYVWDTVVVYYTEVKKILTDSEYRELKDNQTNTK